jgi:hypothetical protein
MRMVVQSLLPGSPPDLSAEGDHLSAITQAALSVPAVNTFNELCPACQVEVPLQDITTAACSNGHTWGKLVLPRLSFVLIPPWQLGAQSQRSSSRRHWFVPVSGAAGRHSCHYRLPMPQSIRIGCRLLRVGGWWRSS